MELKNSSMDQVSVENSIEVFPKISYFLLQMAKLTDPTQFIMSAAHPKLGDVYDRMVKNHVFVEALKENDFYFHGKKVGLHIFRRS